MIQRVSITDRMDDRFDVAVTNVTPARMTFVTPFDLGGSDMRLWIEHEAQVRFRQSIWLKS